MVGGRGTIKLFHDVFSHSAWPVCPVFIKLLCTLHVAQLELIRRCAGFWVSLHGGLGERRASDRGDQIDDRMVGPEAEWCWGCRVLFRLAQ